MKHYDVIWIGTGQATGTVIPQLSKAGKRVAIAERGRVGGTCVNVGCTPTKTLVASASSAYGPSWRRLRGRDRRSPTAGLGSVDIWS